MKTEITLPSGHRLTFNYATLELAKQLKRDIFSELGARVDPRISNAVMAALANRDKKAALMSLSSAEIGTLFQGLCALLASEKIEASVFECAKCCLLNANGPDESVVMASFESPRARRDFIPVGKEVLWRNMELFFGDLFSASSTPGEPTTAAQK
jgi:hypothetical protein